MVDEVVPDLLTSCSPNTNICMYGTRFYYLNEANIPFECMLKPDGTLQPIGYSTLGEGGVSSLGPSSSGFKWRSIIYSYTTNPDFIKEHGIIQIGRYSTSTQRLSSHFVPTSKNEYILFTHGMAHTENYMIIWDCSVHFDATGMFDGESFFRTKCEYNLRFGVVPKNTTTREDVI